jgi:hydroxyacylglutathione hydrolase
MEKRTVFEDGAVEVLQLVVGAFENNAYLLRDRSRNCCALIDAAAEGENVLAVIGNDRLEVILQTHTHMDHVQALDMVRRQRQAPVAIHPQEPEAARLQPERSLADGQEVQSGDLRLTVLHTPGHTPGSVCFLFQELCFCGDTIFPGGPGKTGSPEAFRQIIRSLENKIYTLADSVQLLPGHGDPTTVGASREEYQRFRSRSREQEPWGDVLWAQS